MPSSSSSSSHHHHHHHSHQTTSSSWQQKLEEVCREYEYSAPEYQLVSDRRGGRTAWSSIVVVFNTTIQARYWYDGKNLNNAREDAAEAALNWLQQKYGYGSGY
ncbi:uncharacterized protein PG998_007798 [Apiospora kogelbergensis]|uniref:DRBM domain-containing protein n=1 Tax=Apiospora kogelbergensis TaxID=1337665 RepID=A0AAW0QM70_9PEZI